ncbi:MAG: polymer-forming cytoskeletal protein [candidate division Zixibacteria bacterium]|nr:polymer-forming cytoskeletal protein [candidate division Zixibacteria bacterium]
MAVFRPKDEESGMSEAGGDKVNTLIGKDTVFTGTLQVAGTLRVDGVLKGEVSVSDTIAIGPTGEVDANVKTKNAVVSGTVKGNIYATERVELQAKADISGDLTTKSLVIEQGAVFHGNCNMKTPNVPTSSGQRVDPSKSTLQTKAPLETAEKTRQGAFGSPTVG